MIRVGIIGGLGKMGQETVNAVTQEADMEVGAIIDAVKIGETVKIGEKEYTVYKGIDDVKDKIDMLIDFTGPQSVKKNIDTALALSIDMIVGSTGLLKEDIAEIKSKTEKGNSKVFIIPNFAIGAVLMMEFAKMAAKYMNEAEIIEYHHPAKLDAPSGTAVKTAELIREAKAARPEVKGTELLPGARGAVVDDINIHSVRLNGYVASQEVIFGGLGQTLTIRHDSINRESFMPGVIMAVRNMNKIGGFTYGLENIL